MRQIGTGTPNMSTIEMLRPNLSPILNRSLKSQSRSRNLKILTHCMIQTQIPNLTQTLNLSLTLLQKTQSPIHFLNYSWTP